MSPVLRTSAALLLAAAAGCAGVPERPPVPTLPDGRVQPGARAPGFELPVRSFPYPPGPWVEPRLRTAPADAAAGSALGIEIAIRCGAREPADITASYGDQTVHFGERGGRWFGVLALPPDTSGPGTVTVRYRIADDSVVVARHPLRVRDRRYPEATLSVAPRYSDPPASVRERIREEGRLVDRTLAEVTPRWLLTDDVRWPRPSRVTSPFGQRRVFNGELQSRHWGVDLRGRRGDPVSAAAGGRVALVHDLYFAGRAVFLDHGLGVYSGYFHLSEAMVEEGDLVEPGELIGRVGASGRVTGAHLHWALWVNGVHVDARSLLELEIPSAGASGGRRAACPG